MKKLPKAAFGSRPSTRAAAGAPDKARRIQGNAFPRTGQVNVLYKNIIFDLGGVVVDFDPREFLVDHFMNERVEDQLYDITFGSEEWLQMDAGLLTREEGDRIMREKARLCAVPLRWALFWTTGTICCAPRTTPCSSSSG